MLDKAVMRLSGIHKIMGLLVGLDVLQAIFIIGQAYFLSRTITGLWQGILCQFNGLQFVYSYYRIWEGTSLLILKIIVWTILPDENLVS